MIILGVDPGFTVTGFGIISKNNNKAVLLDYGALRMSSQKTLAERVHLFHNFFTEKIETHRIQALSLETPFLGKNAQNFLKLGYLRGILYLLAAEHKLPLLEFAPTEIKRSITGFGSSSKEQVADMVMRLFPGLALPDKLDITDAVAIAVCGMWKNSSRLTF